jgi:hypothetical protein
VDSHAGWDVMMRTEKQAMCAMAVGKLASECREDYARPALRAETRTRVWFRNQWGPRIATDTGSTRELTERK